MDCWLVVLGFNATLTAQVISWRSVAHMYFLASSRSESYYVWKTMFLNATAELNLSSSEIFDLLINYLGPESRKWALSLRSANLNDPAKGIEKLWMRLYERFGSPEIIESVLKKKLDKFPSLTNRDNKKLYDLSNLLEQISSLVEDPLYSVSLSYFNSSTGVMTIIQKLP